MPRESTQDRKRARQGDSVQKKYNKNIKEGKHMKEKY